MARSTRAEDLQLLSRKVLGWDLPLDGLQYWVRGLQWPALEPPSPQDDDDKGRPKLLKQGDWQVAYLDWTPAGVSGLPSKLDLTGTACACGWWSMSGRSMGSTH